eukprot:1160916-Pelagomonas_calceolata.AAC.6
MKQSDRGCPGLRLMPLPLRLGAHYAGMHSSIQALSRLLAREPSHNTQGTHLAFSFPSCHSQAAKQALCFRSPGNFCRNTYAGSL